MPRTCTVCSSPKRKQIDQALLAGTDSIRDIAGRWLVSRAALQRHKEAGHVSQRVAKSAAAREQAQSIDLVAELRQCLEHVRMLRDACHRYLLNPETGEYDLSPRDHDVWVYYDAPKGKRTIRRKARLSALLKRVEEGLPTIAIDRGETKVADPRELILRASASMESQVRLLGEFLQQIPTQGAVNLAVLAPQLIACFEGMPAELRVRVAERLAALEGPRLPGG